MESESAEPFSTERLAVPVPEPPVMKLTRGHSCILCQQRKVRCDKQKPCANCVKAQVDCKVIPPQPPRRRKKKPHERDLYDRLRKYEALLCQHGVKFDPIGSDLKPSDNADDVADLEEDLSGLKTSPSSSAPDYITGDPQDQKNTKWLPNYSGYRQSDEAQHESSDEDCEGPTIHHAFDTMFGNNDGFPIVVGGSPTSVTNSHPSAIQIWQLWEKYINNVNPLLKVSHVSTLQGQIATAGANPSKIQKPLEALMFGIYFIAIKSMKDEEVSGLFDEDRSVLLARYHTATQQALVNAGFMRSTEIMVLQALFLYLLAVWKDVDPRSLFCLIGIAVRIATRLGLHRDGAQFGITPFETEQRRRLWWQIVAFDKRVAEMTGSTITALSSCGGDCKLPLNINDSDLNIYAKDPPNPSSGPTEMLFALTRIEMTVAAAPGGVRPVPPHPPPTGNKPRVQYSPSPSSPDVVTHVANQNLPQNLDSYCDYIETTYLQHCDQKIPLHFFTLTMTRQSLCKLRIIGFLCRGIPTETLEGSERDALFSEAVTALEYDNMIYAAETLQGFIWYTRLHFPLPVYIFLVSELRQRRRGPLCERAWDVIIENHDRRGLINDLRSPVHIALGGAFVKAWDARESAERHLGRSLQTPKFIMMLRQQMARIPPKNQSHRATSHATAAATTPGNGVHGYGPASGGGSPGMGGVVVGGGGGGGGMHGGSPTGPPGGHAVNTYTRPNIKQQSMAETPPMTQGGGGGGGGMMLDDNVSFPPFDGGISNPIYASPPIPGMDFGQMMDYHLLQMQYDEFPAFGGTGNGGGGPSGLHGAGIYGHGPGVTGGHHDHQHHQQRHHHHHPGGGLGAQ